MSKKTKNVCILKKKLPIKRQLLQLLILFSAKVADEFNLRKQKFGKVPNKNKFRKWLDQNMKLKPTFFQKALQNLQFPLTKANNKISETNKREQFLLSKAKKLVLVSQCLNFTFPCLREKKFFCLTLCLFKVYRRTLWQTLLFLSWKRFILFLHFSHD